MKSGSNRTGQINSCHHNQEPVLEKSQLLQNIRQQDISSFSNLNSSANLNPISSDSECSSSVFA